MKCLLAAVFLIGAFSAAAAERVRAGEWQTTLRSGTGKPMVTKYCVTAREATAMNGNLAALRKYLEESTAEKTNGRCKVKKVVLKGNRTVVTMVCGKTEVVGTTTYFGDRYESSTSNGTTVVGKRLGSCR